MSLDACKFGLDGLEDLVRGGWGITWGGTHYFKLRGLCRRWGGLHSPISPLTQIGSTVGCGLVLELLPVNSREQQSPLYTTDVSLCKYLLNSSVEGSTNWGWQNWQPYCFPIAIWTPRSNGLSVVWPAWTIKETERTTRCAHNRVIVECCPLSWPQANENGGNCKNCLERPAKRSL